MDPATNSDRSLTFLKSLTFLVVMFGLGFGGSVGYYQLFAPPAPPSNSGQLLGVSDTVPTPTSPPLTPTPNLSLNPKDIAKPVKGALAYLKDSQIYQVNSDRTKNTPLTSDLSQKQNLVVSPDKLNLAYTSTQEKDGKSNHNITLLNLKTNKIESLLDSKEVLYLHLNFSPNNRYLSAWNTNGQEAIILDIANKQIILRYSTEDQTGISPIVWIPGSSEAVSFILKGELFTGTITGQDLKVISKDVVGVKTNTQNQDIPVAPVWSDNGKYVSYLKKSGLYFFDQDTQTENAVIKETKDLELDKIPYQPIAFSQPVTHLFYLSPPSEGGKNVYAYSLKDKKSLPTATYGETSLMDPSQNTLLGITDTETVPHLARFTLDKWQESICDNESQNIPVPPYSSLLNSGAKSISTLTHEGEVYTIKVVNLETCTSYDLVKSSAPLSNPLWLSN